MNIYNTLLVISTVDCSEIYQGIRSGEIERWIAVNFDNTLIEIVTVNFIRGLGLRKLDDESR